MNRDRVMGAVLGVALLGPLAAQALKLETALFVADIVLMLALVVCLARIAYAVTEAFVRWPGAFRDAYRKVRDG